MSSVESSKKKWIFHEGILGFYDRDLFIVPSSEEIYAAVFDGVYSARFCEDDKLSLKENIAFSKYPLDLKLVLNSRGDFELFVSIAAFLDGNKIFTLPTEFNEDHVIVGNTWYPLFPDALNQLLETLRKHKSKLGKITFKQYLTLVEESNDILTNEVDFEVLKSANLKDAHMPLLQATLFPYQAKGFQWLNFLHREHIGGILADEMGLGKTIQIIALIAADNSAPNEPTLIISPATLLENWRREFLKFAPKVVTQIHQGPERTGFPSKLKTSDVVITSYDTVVRDSSLFAQIHWRHIICDEAQAIKNPNTKRAIAVKKLPRTSSFAVTGTPIENCLLDLWSIMDFSVPGFLGKQSDFENRYSNETSSAEKLEAVISPLILRRRVSEVASDLPPKIIIPQVLQLTSDEEKEYEEIRSQTLLEFAQHGSLVALTRLRMFCCHPFLISKHFTNDPSSVSNKYIRLLEIVEEVVSNKGKIIIFTSYNDMNDLLVADLSKRFKVFSDSIDGRVPVMHRQAIIDKFASISGSAFLVLNPIAAGTGLNITAANHVIHYNLEWNPAKEDQATARAFRRGQDKPVTIHRLYYMNTVEETINERLDRKRELSGRAIVGTKGEGDDYPDLIHALSKSPKQKR